MTKIQVSLSVLFAVTLLLVGCSSKIDSTSDNSPQNGESGVPGVVGLYGDEAKNIIDDAGFDADLKGVDGELVILAGNWVVVNQSPVEGSNLAPGDEVKLLVSRPEDARDVRSSRLVLDSLKKEDSKWQGFTAKALQVNDSDFCVNLTADSGSEPSYNVIVSFPRESIGETVDGACPPVSNAAPAPTTSSSPNAAPAPTTNPSPNTPSQALTLAQKNAIDSAKSYLDYSGFSRSGLINQLEFEGYSTEDSTFAVDFVAPDWNQQAARVAEDYMNYSSFSRQGLIDQLEFEGFTAEQAEFGAKAVGY